MKLVFMGSPSFAVPALEALLPRHDVVLVVSQPDKPLGRGKKIASPPVANVARANGLPLFQPASARKPDFEQRMREANADAAIVVAYGKILPSPVLTAFPHGCLNIHASLLPAYRGAAPIQWAVISGERETGVTIMRLDEGMDTGPMLLRKAIPIGAKDTAGTLFDKLAPLGAELMLDALDKLAEGDLSEVPQTEEGASTAPMLKKADGEINWQVAASAVSNLSRGVDPWPGAFTRLGKEPFKLFAPRVVTRTGSPGEVLALGEDGIVIACGDGAVCFSEVQAPGKRRMSAADFARGTSALVGTTLGSS